MTTRNIKLLYYFVLRGGEKWNVHDGKVYTTYGEHSQMLCEAKWQTILLPYVIERT